MTDDTSKAQALKPVAVPTDEGEARWWFGSLAVIKATAADTGGQMTIVEITEAPGTEAPLHVHHREDEGFWILEGDVTFEVGDTTIEAHTGDYVFGPRDIPPLHGRRRRVPDALYLHPRRLRGRGDRDERAGRQPHPSPAVRGGAGLGADRGGCEGTRSRAARVRRSRRRGDRPDDSYASRKPCRSARTGIVPKSMSSS